jgi:hypothetical protein
MRPSPPFLIQPQLTGQRSIQDIVNQAVLEVSDRVLYDVEKMRKPVPNGALDARLVGLSGLWY